jgi:creatinine amidohydrolase
MGHLQYLADLTYPEADKALKGSTCLLPVGALEAHGPHLPLSTDTVLAEEVARRAGEKLKEWKPTAVVLPALAVTPAKFASAFAGTVGISEGTAAAYVCEVAKSLEKHGAAKLILVSPHVDPANLKALHAAVEAMKSAPKIKVIFPDITKKPWVDRLPDEFKRGGAHAGNFETSMMMAAKAKAVRESERIGLAKVEVDLGAKIRGGAKTFEECGGDFAYFGDPATASKEEGDRCLDLLRDIVVEAATGE